MKIRSALLLCGVLLIAARPLWADRIESEKESRIFELSVNLPCPLAFIERVELKTDFDAGDSTFSAERDEIFRWTSDVNMHPDNLRDLESDERAPFISLAAKAPHKEKEGNGEIASEKNEVKTTLSAVPVPEPDSLSVLLVGLAVVGIWSRRRQELPPTI